MTLILNTTGLGECGETLFRMHNANTKLDVIADGCGRFTVRLEQRSLVRLQTFQPVVVTRPGVYYFAGHGSPLSIDLMFAGAKLRRDPRGDARTLFVDPLPPAASGPSGLVFPNRTPSADLSVAELHFVETIFDIDKKLLDRSRYSLIRASGLLRHVLVDGGASLVDQANRRKQLKFVFKILDSTTMMHSVVKGLWLDVSPHRNSQSPGVLAVNRDRFLSTKVLLHDGVWATVRDVIKACANAKGGVHTGPAKTPEEQAVLALDDETIGGVDAELSIAMLAGLCRVVLLGLAPLVEALTVPVTNRG
jgi:hypothetical protein